MLGSRVMPSFAYFECHCSLFRRARSQTCAYIRVHMVYQGQILHINRASYAGSIDTFVVFVGQLVVVQLCVL